MSYIHSWQYIRFRSTSLFKNLQFSKLLFWKKKALLVKNTRAALFPLLEHCNFISYTWSLHFILLIETKRNGTLADLGYWLGISTDDKNHNSNWKNIHYLVALLFFLLSQLHLFLHMQNSKYWIQASRASSKAVE